MASYWNIQQIVHMGMGDTLILSNLVSANTFSKIKFAAARHVSSVQACHETISSIMFTAHEESIHVTTAFKMSKMSKRLQSWRKACENFTSSKKRSKKRGASFASVTEPLTWVLKKIQEYVGRCASTNSGAETDRQDSGSKPTRAHNTQ